MVEQLEVELSVGDRVGRHKLAVAAVVDLVERQLPREDVERFLQVTRRAARLGLHAEPSHERRGVDLPQVEHLLRERRRPFRGHLPQLHQVHHEPDRRARVLTGRTQIWRQFHKPRLPFRTDGTDVAPHLHLPYRREAQVCIPEQPRAGLAPRRAPRRDRAAARAGCQQGSAEGHLVVGVDA